MMTLRTGALAVAGAILLAGSAGIANAQPTKASLKCASGKLKLLAKDYGGKLKCYSKGVSKGIAVVPLTDPCLVKVEDKTIASWAKLLAKGGCAADANFFDQNETCVPMAPIGDGIPDGEIGSILNIVNCGFPGTSGIDDLMADLIPNPATPSKCTAKKAGALGKLAAAFLGCEAKLAGKDLRTDFNDKCFTKAIENFNKAFAKEEAKVTNDCQTTGDAEFLGGELFRTYLRLVPTMPRFEGCGNGLVTKGPSFPDETCDDGDREFYSICPDTCQIAFCDPDAGTPIPVTVRVSNTGLDAVLVGVDYPEGKVDLPGLGFEADVTLLVAGGDFLDYEHAIRILGVQSPSFGQNEVAQLNMVGCIGAPAPTESEFRCEVLQASVSGTDVPVAGLTCSVTIP